MILALSATVDGQTTGHYLSERLADAGVTLLDELTWSRGLSFYFHDPEGNLLEIANADIWPP